MGRFDKTKEDYDKHDAESGSYFKLTDGQTRVVAFLGDPFNKEVYWTGSTYDRWTENCGGRRTLKTMNRPAGCRSGSPRSTCAIAIP